MTQILVEPASVQAYEGRAEEIFGLIHSRLEALVNDCVAVEYYGENSVQFKRKVGAMAATFAADMHQKLGGMSAAVWSSTQSIASTLGGAVGRIDVNNRPITPPEPAVVDYVSVETTALQALVPTVSGHFTYLRGQLADHKAELIKTKWEGTAKTSAVGAVSNLTTAAETSCTTAEDSINRAITEQLEATIRADV